MIRLGLIGLGTMGLNLALNARDHGYQVIGYDANTPQRSAFSAQAAGVAADSIPDLVASLDWPRVILLLVPAGPAVDGVLEQLCPLLAPGDIVVDAGNSNFHDSKRRFDGLKSMGLLFVGLGVSGGEMGARHGPAMMAGGDSHAVEFLRDILAPLAAKSNGQPCFGYFGDAGAGHFIKMVHNGIEYAEMQVIAETVHLLRDAAGLAPQEIAQVLSDWSQGVLGSYLLEITADILRRVDGDSGLPLVDVILDVAEQNGTGSWVVSTALDLLVPVPTIAASVDARTISRNPAARALHAAPKPVETIRNAELVPVLQRSLLASRLSIYAQAFELLDATRDKYGWQMNLPDVAANWRAGCIIRSRLMETLLTTSERPKPGENLLYRTELTDSLGLSIATLRESLGQAISSAITHRVPTPALSASLAYLDSLFSTRLCTDIIQAQRDYFGSHGFQRRDRAGKHHGPWKSPV